MSEFDRDDGVSRPSGLKRTTITRPIIVSSLGAVVARNVEPGGTLTRNFREFINGEVDVETGRISGRVALRQIATIPVVVAIGGTLIMACAAAAHG
jgi:hypothetical protein